MSRTLVIEKTVYPYSELSDDAKENVQRTVNQWAWEDGQMHESMQMIADAILEKYGFGPATNLEYDLYLQGGFPLWDTESNGAIFLEEPAPGRRRKRYVVSIKNHVVHVWDRWRDEVSPDNSSSLIRALNDKIQDEMFWAFREEDEYQSSDEVVGETCEANGWEFTKSGELA